MIRFSRKSIYPEFSNFHTAIIEYDGLVYCNAEGAFQAQKCIDYNERSKFALMSGGQAKKAGRTVQLRSDWEDIKFDIMCNVVYAKFTQNENLKAILLATGDEYLLEDTSCWHDNTWGRCSCVRCTRKLSKNMLGIALMYARARIRGLDECNVKVQLNDKTFTINLYTLREEAGEKYDELIDSINKYGK